MSLWTFETDAEAAEYCVEIAVTMVHLFGIPLAEAIARMNEHWAGQSMPGEFAPLFYRWGPEQWAKNIYYAFSVRWWAEEPGELIVKPLPSHEIVEAAMRYLDAHPAESLLFEEKRIAAIGAKS